MTITIKWWMIVIVLTLFPIAYAMLRKPQGDYDFMIDSVIVWAVCWCLAIGLSLGKLL